MFSDRVGELYKAPMLFCGDERSYLATVVLHGSVAFEIGSQSWLFRGRDGTRRRRGFRRGQKIRHPCDALPDLSAQRAAIGRARRLDIFQRHGASRMLRADGAAQETVLVKDPDFREVAGIVTDGDGFADISRQCRIDVAQPLKTYPVPPHGTRLRDRQQKKIEVVQTVGHARQPALAAAMPHVAFRRSDCAGAAL